MNSSARPSVSWAMLLPATVCGLVLAIAGSAAARPIVHKSISYFTISGKTAEQLDAQISQHGPEVADMGRHPGATQIRFSGNATYSNNGKTCSISRAKVIVNIKIILPRWKYQGTASPGLGLLWNTLSGDIRRHEDRHAEIAVIHARNLEQALVGLPPQRDCAAMEVIANDVTDREIAAHDADQQRFDRVEAINFEARMGRLLRYHSELALQNRYPTR
jgi:predicted secreted Zn-dependent protease